MTDDETPEPAKRTIIRGPVSATPPEPDALREELAAEQIRDFQEIVDATPPGRPYLLYTVGEIADHLVDIYDRGTMGNTVTWDLIAELMRRIPDSDLVEIEPAVPRVRIVPETPQDATIAEEYEAYNEGRTPQDPPVRPARPLEDETVRPVSPDVIGCRVLTGYIVELTFDEGTVKAVDLTPFLWGEMFERVVADYELFRQVHVDPELGTIAWPGDIDISPEALWVAPAVEPADAPPWEQPATPRRRTTVEYVTVEEERARLRPVLDKFEARYGLPSERLVEAFTVDGVLEETEDFISWYFAYATWHALAGEGID